MTQVMLQLPRTSLKLSKHSFLGDFANHPGTSSGERFA
jgi:hypothetical protein